ncbi:sodium:proton antiporter [Candidatus Thiosymbion oneisti]|uniref:sodium:proton antiporter n=1 Tax=Candidatus Thiosymbion oneisti TaxID=589554 RepID=UPI000B802533|nr:sodium:proton antiporter [Candidatus Thiosymbion oneisti]
MSLTPDGISLPTIVLASGFMVVLIGLWGMMTRRNIIQIIIGFSLTDTGIHMVMVAIGYLNGRTAPIIDAAVDRSQAASTLVDPIPSALVLTAIVIGLGITALMLSYAIQIYKKNRSLSIDDCSELKG